MEWLVEHRLVDALRQPLDGETLLTDPIVYPLDEAALSRYERRVPVR